MLDYRINTFLQLCDTMNYRITAERLNITQPAVTQHIQYLEEEYGCRLFSYNHKKLSKTKAAEILEDYARTAMYNEQAMRKAISLPTGQKLRIGATKTIGDFVIDEYAAAFLEHERHSLNLTVDNTASLLKLVNGNELDFAIVEGIFDKSRFGSRLFRREPFVGICSPSHPFAGKQVGMEEIFSQPVLLREKGSGTREILEQILMEQSFSIGHFKNQICIGSFELLKRLVLKNSGISFVYEAVAKSDSRMAVFTLEGGTVMREFNFVYLKDTKAVWLIELFLGETG